MLLVYRWILRVQPSTNSQRRLEKDDIRMWIRLIHLQSYSFWSKKHTYSIFKNCCQNISRIYLQNNCIIFQLLDDLIHIERSLKMAKNYVTMMPINTTISEHKEVHISNPYRNITRTHCMQRRHKGWLWKNKDHSRLKTTSESKTGQSITRTHRILQEIY